MSELLPALVVGHDVYGEAAAARARWTAFACGRGLVTLKPGQLDGAEGIELLSPVMQRFGGLDKLQTMHVVGPLEDTLEAAEAESEVVVAHIARMRAFVQETFAQHQNPEHWIVHQVGQQLDASETKFVGTILDKQLPDLAGIILIFSGSRHRALHVQDELVCFASDIVLSLISTSIAGELAAAEEGFGRVWAASAKSVIYPAPRIAEIESSEHAVAVLNEHLLEDLRSDDTGLDSGRLLVKELTNEPDGQFAISESPGILTISSLRRSYLGGAADLLSRLRNFAVDWKAVPITAWTDLLVQWQRLVIRREFPSSDAWNDAMEKRSDLDYLSIEATIERNGREFVTRLKDVIAEGAFRQLDDSRKIRSCVAFLDGVKTELDEYRLTIKPRPIEDDRGKPFDEAWIPALRDKLRRHTELLPFGPAVALRVFALAIAVLLVVAPFSGGADLPVVSSLSKPYARFAAVLTVVLGYIVYQAFVSRTLRLRDRLKEALELQLVARTEALLAQQIRDDLAAVIRWIGRRPEWFHDGPELDVPEEPPAAVSPSGPPDAEADGDADGALDDSTLIGWWSWLFAANWIARAGLDGASEVAVPVNTTKSDYSLVIVEDGQFTPAAADVDGAAGEAAARLAELARPYCDPPELRFVPVDKVLELWRTWLERRLHSDWPDSLSDLVDDHEVHRGKAYDVLRHDITPTFGAGGEHVENQQPQMYVIVHGGEGSALDRSLRNNPDAPLVAQHGPMAQGNIITKDGKIPDLALMLHIYALPGTPFEEAVASDATGAAES